MTDAPTTQRLPARFGPLIESQQTAIGAARRIIVAIGWLLMWMYLYLVVVLGAWVMVAWFSTGWQPTTVTSGSMSPSINAGDVVFYDVADNDSIAQRTIVLFTDADGEQVLHRVFAVEADGYVTKGDANSDPDGELVTPDQIVGVGRLVVPLVGLPVVWWTSGNTVVVAAWLILTVGGALASLLRSTGWRSFQRSSRRPGSGITRKAVRRVRVLVGLMIASQFAIDASRFDGSVGSVSVSPVAVLIGSITMLAFTNVVSLRSGADSEREDSDGWGMAELVLDTALVIALTTTTGTNGIGWVLFALPIIEAAARFRLAGALTHWMVLTGVTIAVRVAIGSRESETSLSLLGDLDRVVDQLSVLLLVVVPGAYLAEQLVADVLVQRRATGAAEHRSRILQQVAELGQEVTQIDRNLFDTLTRGMLAMGIEAADVVAAQPGAPWVTLSAASITPDATLPPPGAPASGLRPADMDEPSVSIDRHDPDPDDRRAMTESRWTNLVRLAINGPNRSIIAVRVATSSGQPIDLEIIDALQLLLGQAAVGIENNHLVDELRSLNEKIQTQATQDALTGLPNRRLLLSHIEEIISAADEAAGGADRSPSLLFLDLNGFKPINDRFGHEAGDELLMAVAGRLIRTVGDHGLVARLGGDEFTVMLHGRSIGGRAVDPDRMAAAVGEAVAQPFAIERGQVSVTTSIGIAELGDISDAEELIRRADVAMYRAKNDVTIPWARYETSMDAAARRAAELGPHLADAIENDELSIHYQPMVTTARRRIAGVEALLRWESAEFGWVRPDEIVAIAEVNGLHDALNQWIIETATAQVADWQKRFAVPELFLTVNASPTELQSRHLASNMSRALLLSGLQPASLIVELSERLTTEQDTEMLRSLDELAHLGIRVILDDFGQGQTSLAHLRQLPLVGIKLDRQLVVQAAEAQSDLVILTSMVSLAHDLDLRVVAEGVETENQFQVVANAGADLVQGYLVGRPVDAAEITAKLAAGALEMASAGPLSPSAEAAG